MINEHSREQCVQMLRTEKSEESSPVKQISATPNSSLATPFSERPTVPCTSYKELEQGDDQD